MKVNSTGLGKTTMVAHFAELVEVEDNGMTVMALKIEATEPVHWSIRATVGGDDLRTFAKLLLKPSIFFRALRMVCSGAALTSPEKK
jgi:hypothetical protein